jgi:thiol-disulfide isomerase/thioredoxin
MIKLIRRLANRPRSTAPISVTLWGKADCCLCDRALVILEKLAREYPLQIDKRDITTDPSTYERLRFVIPVVEIERGPRFEGKITEYWLRQALDRRSG